MPLVSQVFDANKYALRGATDRDVEKNADAPIKHIAIQLLGIAGRLQCFKFCFGFQFSQFTDKNIKIIK